MGSLINGVTKDSYIKEKNFDKMVLQQDVPILDSDWNELQDIIRMKRRLILDDLYTNGANDIPSAITGDFAIVESTTQTTENFQITLGRWYQDGVVMELWEDLDYEDRATVLHDVLEFEAAIVWSNTDLYLWIRWEEQLIALSDDSDIENNGFGETCGRKKLVMIIYPDYTGNDLSGTKGQRLAHISIPQPGHVITNAEITDQRVEKEIKTEIGVVVDQVDVKPDATEAETWDVSIDSLLNNLNRIRHMLQALSGAADWKTDPIDSINGLLNETTSSYLS